MAQTGFGLRMRVGVVPIADLRRDGFHVYAARFRASENIDFAMLSGDGLTEAERRVKAADSGARYEVSSDGSEDADFQGFECRWRAIPSARGEVVSLLVKALAADRQAAAKTYQRVIEWIEQTQADAAPGKPVMPESLPLAGPQRALRSGSACAVRPQFWPRIPPAQRHRQGLVLARPGLDGTGTRRLRCARPRLPAASGGQHRLSQVR